MRFSTEVEEKPTNVLPDLILKVSQNTSPSKAHRTYLFANNIDEITMTLGNYSSEFNSKHASEIHRMNKHCLSDGFNLKSGLPSCYEAQIDIKNLQHWLFSLGLQQIFCIAEEYSQEPFVYLLSLLRRSDCPINISCT